jgi:branched-chain amino acid transport system permease protein
VVVGIIVLTGFYGWLVFSKLGLQMRALADNPVELALYGYNVRMLRIISFSMAGFLCGISSLLVAYDIGFDPQGGLATLLLAVVAMIVGGRNSFAGPVLGGIILGVTRSEVVWFLSARWQEAVTFLLLALFLFFRPNGLLSPKTRLEAVE